MESDFTTNQDLLETVGLLVNARFAAIQDSEAIQARLDTDYPEYGETAEDVVNFLNDAITHVSAKIFGNGYIKN